MIIIIIIIIITMYQYYDSDIVYMYYIDNISYSLNTN